MAASESPAAPAAPPPDGVVAQPRSVEFPGALAAALARVALRTELGRAYWEGFVAGKVADYPWLTADPATLRFRVPDGEVASPAATAALPVPDGLEVPRG